MIDWQKLIYKGAKYRLYVCNLLYGKNEIQLIDLKSWDKWDLCLGICPKCIFVHNMELLFIFITYIKWQYKKQYNLVW